MTTDDELKKLAHEADASHGMTSRRHKGTLYVTEYDYMTVSAKQLAEICRELMEWRKVGEMIKIVHPGPIRR